MSGFRQFGVRPVVNFAPPAERTTAAMGLRGRSMLLNSRVTDAPEMVRCTLAARRRRHREKFIFWRGVFAAQGRPRIKLTEDMEDSTPPSDNVGAKLLPVTDAECGASYKESPEQSDETRSFVAGTSVILKGLSTVQFNGQAGKILSQDTRQDSSASSRKFDAVMGGRW